MRERTYGLVIQRVEYSETSLIVSFLSPEFGQVRTIARGARRNKNPFQSALDLLAMGEMLFIPKPQGLSILTDFYLEENFPLLRKNLQRYYASCYVVEILRHISQEGMESRKAYRVSLQILKHLEMGVPPSLCLCLFDLHILDFLGVFPNISCCLFCEKELAKSRKWFFSLSLGGIVCLSCEDRERNLQALLPSVLKIVHGLKRASLSSIQTISIPRRKLEEVEGFLHLNMAYFLERKPYLLKFIGRDGS